LASYPSAALEDEPRALWVPDEGNGTICSASTFQLDRLDRLDRSPRTLAERVLRAC
jgi:hypothetical protein